MKPLADRIREWGYRQGKRDENGRPCGWCFSWSVWEAGGDDASPNYGKVTANLGPHTGYGWTTNEALNNLADGLVEDGWPDDRSDVEDQRA